jgi:hypothetical protein
LKSIATSSAAHIDSALVFVSCFLNDFIESVQGFIQLAFDIDHRLIEWFVRTLKNLPGLCSTNKHFSDSAIPLMVTTAASIAQSPDSFIEQVLCWFQRHAHDKLQSCTAAARRPQKSSRIPPIDRASVERE